MNFKNTLKFAHDQLSEIKELLRKMSEEEKIPEIEIDLTLSKLRELYDVILLIKNCEKTPKEKDDDINNDTVQRENIEFNGEDGIFPGDNKNEAENKDIEMEVIIPKKEYSISKERISDQYTNKGVSINENIGTAFTKKDLSATLKSKPVEDINKAIGLNEKFALIKELFDGNADKYNNTIKILNNASDFNKAYNYILETFNWDMDSELVQYILDLIRRKFIVHNG